MKRIVSRLMQIVTALILLEALVLEQLEAAVVGVTVGTSAGQVLAAPATRGYRLVIIRNQVWSGDDLLCTRQFVAGDRLGRLLRHRPSHIADVGRVQCCLRCRLVLHRQRRKHARHG